MRGYIENFNIIYNAQNTFVACLISIAMRECVIVNEPSFIRIGVQHDDPIKYELSIVIFEYIPLCFYQYPWL